MGLRPRIQNSLILAGPWLLDFSTELAKKRIPFGRSDGSLTAKERVHAIEKFKEGSNDDSKTGSVLLLSMKAGCVRLKLVAASTVFIHDPKSIV